MANYIKTGIFGFIWGRNEKPLEDSEQKSGLIWHEMTGVL